MYQRDECQKRHDDAEEGHHTRSLFEYHASSACFQNISRERKSAAEANTLVLFATESELLLSLATGLPSSRSLALLQDFSRKRLAESWAVQYHRQLTAMLLYRQAQISDDRPIPG